MTDRHLDVVNIAVDGVPIKEWQAMHDGYNYQSTLDVEPITGVLMEAHGRVQFTTWLKAVQVRGCENLHLFPQMNDPKNFTYNGVRYVNSVFPRTMIPFFYMDRHAKMDQHFADKVHTMVMFPLMFAKYGGWGIFSFSIVIALICVACGCYRMKISAPEEVYLTPEGLSKNQQGNSYGGVNTNGV